MKNVSIIKQFYRGIFAIAMVLCCMIIVSPLESKAAETMNANIEYNIVLDENSDFRWNVNGPAEIGSVVHLDDKYGENCNFKFVSIGNDYYGIKFIKNNGTNRFVDVDGKSEKQNEVIHIWDKDSCNEAHQQFKLYYQGTNADGEKLYYIQVKKSGLWLGLQGNTSPKREVKVAQVSKENRKLWRVTAGEGDPGASMPTDGKVTVTSVEDVRFRWNVNMDADVGNEVHMDTIGGANCNFQLYATGDGFYGIKHIHHGSDNTDYFVDVAGNNDDVGEALHLFSPNDYSQRNRQFSFHEAGKNEETGQMMYYIQARHSGLWVGYENNAKPASDVKLVQVKEENRKLFYVLSAEATEEEDERGKLWNSVDTKEWMKYLSDDTKLSSINMPGTHDSGTKHTELGSDIFPVQCQNTTILEQLNMGVRVFDIRLEKETPEDSYNLCHNGLDCHLKYEIAPNGDVYGIPLMFERDVLETWIYPFLEEHPTETVVLYIMEQGSETDNRDRDMANWLDGVIEKNKKMWCTDNEDIVLKKVRGQIVLASRMNNPSIEHPGIDFSDWSSEALYRGELYVNEEGETIHATIQDNYSGYNLNEYKKRKIYESVLKMSEYNLINKNDFIVNYSSANNCGFIPDVDPDGYSEDINPHIEDYNFQYGVKYGWQMWDYVYQEMCENLISSNVYNVKVPAGGDQVQEKVDVEAPSAPTLKSKTYDSITVDTIPGQEYKLGDGNWQDGGTFTGLNENTEYEVFTRIKETATHKISEESEALIVITEHSPQVPEETDKPQKEEAGNIVETGDSTNSMLFVIIGLISITGIGVLVYRRKMNI